MWRDIGMDDWFMEIGQADGEVLWTRLEEILANPSAARVRARRIFETAPRSDREMMLAAATSVPLNPPVTAA